MLQCPNRPLSLNTCLHPTTRPPTPILQHPLLPRLPPASHGFKHVDRSELVTVSPKNRVEKWRNHRPSEGLEGATARASPLFRSTGPRPSLGFGQSGRRLEPTPFCSSPGVSDTVSDPLRPSCGRRGGSCGRVPNPQENTGESASCSSVQMRLF